MKITKRNKITAATDIDTAFHGMFEELASRFSNWYKVTIDDDMHLTFTRTGSDSKYLPEIEVETRQDPDDGLYYLVPKLTFPELDQDDLEYYDSIHYWISEWERIGKRISELNEFTYNDDPEYYED